MKKEEKIVFAIIAVIMVIAIIIIVNIAKATRGKDEVESDNKELQNVEKYVTNLEDGTKINTSKELNNTKKYKEIEISNIQFTYKDGVSVLLADVKNNGSTTSEMQIIKMQILDENNEVIDELAPVMPEIQPGETEQLNVIISGANCVNAKDFKIIE